MVVCARVNHYLWDGTLFAFAPYARELDLWAGMFDELAIVGTLIRSAPPGDAAAFSKDNIQVIAVPPPSHRGFLGRVAGVLRTVKTARIIYSSIDSRDAVHVRCPCDLGLLGAIVGPMRSRFLFAKYAGDWHAKAVPVAWRLQRMLLRSPWWRGPVAIYGDPTGLPRKITRVFNSTLSEADLARGLDVARSKTWSGPFKVLFVGRLSHEKEPMAVVKAVRTLVREKRDVRLTLIGEGPEEGPIREFLLGETDLSSRVMLVGGLPLEAVIDAYNEAHCLVLVSRTEGFPKVVFEAMAHGLVCIVSAVGVLPSLLDRRSVCFVKSGDSRMIAECLREFDADRAKAKAKGLALQKLASEFTLERLEILFRGIVSEAWCAYGRGHCGESG